MRFLTYTALAMTLAACGEISYKQGGSAQEIERAHQACRGRGDQFAACLAEHGWQAPKIDALDPLFATVEVTDNRQPTPANTRPLIVLSPEETESSAAVSAQTAMAAAASDTQNPTAAHTTAHDGPEVTYVINSWWKMGAFPEQLSKDQQHCSQQLGADYAPDYQTQTFKRAFIVCMHDQGWMAVRTIK